MVPYVTDLFVCGKSIQKKLLFERDLTFRSAYNVALSMKMASKSSRELSAKPNSHSANVNKVTGYQMERNSTPNGSQACVFKWGKKEGSANQQGNHCGGHHQPNKCKFKNERCHTRAKIGHIFRMCRNSRCNAVCK